MADVVVSAVGALHRPRYPDLPGRGDFAGPRWHSARWDHTVDLRGKRVGVIGNAASAVQFVPEIAPAAERVFVFQRSAHWILPRGDRRYSPLEQRLFRVPLLQRLYRAAIYLRLELLFQLVLRPARRSARWVRAMLGRHLRAAIPEPELRAQLTPSYPPGCKRGLLSDDYYPAVRRDDVELVTAPLVAETPAGVTTAAGDVALDALIYATGFDPMDLGPLRVYGRDGHELGARWQQAPQAHLGITVPGFPNFYVLLGPNTGLGHNSVVWMVECQVNYVARCLSLQRRHGVRALEVRPGALRRFYAQLGARMQGMVWSACHSWYRRDDGLVFALWPSSTVRYWWETLWPRRADFAARR